MKRGKVHRLTAWQPYNGARLSVTSKTSGVSSSLPNSLEVQIPKVVAGPIGFENTGYWGQYISPQGMSPHSVEAQASRCKVAGHTKGHFMPRQRLLPVL